MHGSSWMPNVRRLASCAVLTVLFVAGCSPSTSAGREGLADRPEPSKPKRVVVAITSAPPTFSARLNRPLPAGGVLEALVHAGLTQLDNTGVRRPQLAEAVPSFENELWKVAPDGRMETTWTLRNDANWHDGAPLTAEDLLFTYQVAVDKDITVFDDATFRSIEAVELREARTVTVKWNRLYIYADALFSSELAMPLPKHLLGTAYAQNKESFTALPYWNQEFIGAGPYKVGDFAVDSYARLQANDRYVFGRPRVDDLEVRFIADPSTIMAHMLAGAIDLTAGGRSIGIEQGKQMLTQGWQGTIQIPPSGLIWMFPQHINPDPPIIANPQFRRGLVHAIDRQEIADTLLGGMSEVAHNFVAPGEPEHNEVDGSVVRYEYDPRRAAQLIESLGFTRGSDGMYRDSANGKLTVELRTFVGDINEKSELAVADYWRRVGVDTEPIVVPTARQLDREYMATFSGFILLRQGSDLKYLKNLQSPAAPIRDNNFTVQGGTNYGRYSNPEFDALVDRIFMTIPWQERMALARQAVRHVTDQLVGWGLFYNPQPNVVSDRILNVPVTAQLWNVHQWDVK